MRARLQRFSARRSAGQVWQVRYEQRIVDVEGMRKVGSFAKVGSRRGVGRGGVAPPPPFQVPAIARYMQKGGAVRRNGDEDAHRTWGAAPFRPPPAPSRNGGMSEAPVAVVQMRTSPATAGKRWMPVGVFMMGRDGKRVVRVAHKKQGGRSGWRTAPVDHFVEGARDKRAPEASKISP